MKRKIFFLVFLPTMILMASCQGEGSSLSSSSSSSSLPPSSTGTSQIAPTVESYALEVSSLPSKTTYNRYDTLELSGLVVQLVGLSKEGEVLKAEAFDDYTLSMDGVEVSEGFLLATSGMRKTITVLSQSEEYPGLSTSFTIRVNSLQSMNQWLEMEGEIPTYYSLGDTFLLPEIAFTLRTERVDIDGNVLKSETLLSLDDLSFTIDGEDAEGYFFENPGRHSFKATVDGLEEEIVFERTIYSLAKENADPETFPEEGKLTPDDSTMTVRIVQDEADASFDNFYAPEDVVIDYGIYEYGKNAYDEWVYAPSKPLEEATVAKTPLLVVPVILPGAEKEADESKRELIRKTFFGASGDLAYESLHSYYWKSSFGKLDITGTVTDFFYAGDMSDLPATGSLTPALLSDLAEDACEWAKTAYDLDFDDYDSDDDGTVDGVWMVFIGRESNDLSGYWGLSGTTGYKGTKEDPAVNNYGFIGMDFIDGSYSSGMDKGGDAHVVIHETGHMLGLMDYYSYDGDTYSPLGGLDVMDGGIMDHNPYSKMLLGWTKPYIVYGNAEITIPSCQQEDALIVIPYEGKTYDVDADGKVHFNPFDEYLVLDYYTDSNFNAVGYDYAGDYPVQGEGGRLYHVDSRLAYRSGAEYLLFENPDDALSYDGKVAKLITNSRTSEYGESALGLKNADAFDEIRWISKDGVYVDYTKGKPDEDALFLPGDIFSLSEYVSQFVDGSFDNGKACDYRFEILSIA